MAFDFIKLTEWLKLAPRYLFAVALIAGALLFVPTATLQNFGLGEFGTKFRGWIAGAFLVSIVLLLVNAGAMGTAWLRSRINHRKRQMDLKTFLRNMSPEECAAIAGYILMNTKTRDFDINNGTANSLEAVGILYRSSHVSRWHLRFPYTMHSWVWEYLKKHPEALAHCDQLESDV